MATCSILPWLLGGQALKEPPISPSACLSGWHDVLPSAKETLQSRLENDPEVKALRILLLFTSFYFILLPKSFESLLKAFGMARSQGSVHD